MHPSVTAVDIAAQYKGATRTVDGFGSTARRRLVFEDARALTPFDSGNDIASADSITLPDGGTFFTVTGTTTINTIVETGQTAGRRVTLLFESAVSVGTGGNITGISSGQKDFNANSAVDVLYDGTDWRLIGIDKSGT